MQIFHIKNNRKNYFLLFISKSICQCPFLLLVFRAGQQHYFLPFYRVALLYIIVRFATTREPNLTCTYFKV